MQKKKKNARRNIKKKKEKLSGGYENKFLFL